MLGAFRDGRPCTLGVGVMLDAFGILLMQSRGSRSPDTHTFLVTEFVSDGELFNHVRASALQHEYIPGMSRSDV